jgi:hypothetical protein
VLFLDLAMLDARRLFLCPSRGVRAVLRPLATVVVGNPRDCFVFLDFLRFDLQIQDNYFIPIFLLVSTYLASCILLFD